jgi:hypothetical protein
VYQKEWNPRVDLKVGWSVSRVGFWVGGGVGGSVGGVVGGSEGGVVGSYVGGDDGLAVVEGVGTPVDTQPLFSLFRTLPAGHWQQTTLCLGPYGNGACPSLQSLIPLQSEFLQHIQIPVFLETHVTYNPFGQLGIGVDGFEGEAVAKGNTEHKWRSEVRRLRLAISLCCIANNGNKKLASQKLQMVT